MGIDDVQKRYEERLKRKAKGRRKSQKILKSSIEKFNKHSDSICEQNKKNYLTFTQRVAILNKRFGAVTISTHVTGYTGKNYKKQKKGA